MSTALHADRAAASASAARADAGAAASTRRLDDADYCATCAILALLSGAQTASAPVFVLPVALASAEIAVAPASARASILATRRIPLPRTSAVLNAARRLAHRPASARAMPLRIRTFRNSS